MFLSPATGTLKQIVSVDLEKDRLNRLGSNQGLFKDILTPGLQLVFFSIAEYLSSNL